MPTRTKPQSKLTQSLAEHNRQEQRAKKEEKQAPFKPPRADFDCVHAHSFILGYN